MTPDDHLLASLAAALAPARAAALLARLPGARGLPAHAAARAGAPRAERLRALAAALAASRGSPARAEAAAAGERPRVAALLRRLGSGASTPPGVSPLLLRLLRERL